MTKALGPDHGVSFADMTRLGRNPGRIISVWRKFVLGNTHAGRGWPGHR